MTEQDFNIRFDELSRKLDAIYASTEKTRKYFLAVLIITVVAFVVPLIGLVFAVPSLLSNYNTLLQDY